MNIETAPSKHAHSFNAYQTIASTLDSESFKSARKQGLSLGLALEESAGRMADRDYDKGDIDSVRQADAYAVLATVNEYTHGIEGIRHSQEVKRLDDGEFRANKGRSVEFNHAVKEMLKNDPTLDAHDMVEFVTTAHALLNEERWKDDPAGWKQEQAWFKEQFETALRGMQHEIFASQILDAMEDVKYDSNVGVEDDLRGVDMYVTIDGVTFPVDIKASGNTAIRKQKKSIRPASIIWSGCGSNEFKGRFRMTTEEASQRVPYMREKLMAAREEHMKRTQNFGQNVVAICRR